jgi:hypothetical protein
MLAVVSTERSLEESIKVYLDTGTTNHFIKDAHLLKNLHDIESFDVLSVYGRTKITQAVDLEPFGRVFFIPGGNTY